MNEQGFKDRTKRFEVRVVNLVAAPPKGLAADVIGRQLLRSGPSAGANYSGSLSGADQQRM